MPTKQFFTWTWRSNWRIKEIFKPNDLIGQEVTIRYPQRKPVEAPPNQRPQDIVANGEFGQGFTIQSADVKVKVVGLVSGESAGPGGFGGSRIMLPLELVERLNAVQGFDVREVVANPGETIYPSLTMLIDNPNHVQAVEDAVKQIGIRRVFFIRCSAQFAARFQSIRFVSA